MELLNELSRALSIDEEFYKVLSSNSELLETSLSFSVKFSSRAPTDFIPHQTLLWALDAWESVDSVRAKIASSILEMWFRWHSFLWTHSPVQFKVGSDDSPLPYMLFQPTKTAALERILQSAISVKDYDGLCLMLRVASGNLWNDSSSNRDMPNILLASARSLFEQILHAHKRSFDKETYAEIKSTFSSSREFHIKYEQIQRLSLFIASSSHSRLTSLMDSYITPLLRELYLQNFSHDFYENLGHAWLHLGGLRFHLLHSPDDFDPSMKYSIKNCQIMDKISLLDLEIKVRQECANLVGRISDDDVLEQRQCLVKKLEVNRRRLQRKLVYRDDASKFKRLKSECGDFLELIASSTELTKNIATMSMPQIINKAFNWQEAAASFIYRLSDEYAAYADITQPIQVAVYEMKLGLSLVVSSALQKTFVAKIERSTTDGVMETICDFMQFPRGFALPLRADEARIRSSDYQFSAHEVSAGVLPMDINLLEKLCTVYGDNFSDKQVSGTRLHAALYHNVLVRVTHSTVNSLLLGPKDFKLLTKIFEKFAGLWMSMKIQAKSKEDDEDQNFKFKTRKFKIEDIIDVNLSTLVNSISDESLSVEWQDMMAEDDCTTWVVPKGQENLEEAWGLIPESILNSMVHLHNRFFGSYNLVDDPGFIQIADAEKLSSFLESYKLGLELAKVLPALLSSSLDAKLGPEQLLYLCLEYEEKSKQLSCPDRIYNFYTDSNAPMMAMMETPLRALEQQVLSLLNERPDHPGLQNIHDLTETLLAIPLSTPLAKGLSALQFLLNKAHQLKENAPKLSLSDQMQPILVLVSTWLKIELDSCVTLLDGVQQQYEINSGKLWFPLYSVLYQRQTADISGDSHSTTQSLEEFVQTSSIGEFKRRLQLILAFHGQIGVDLKFNSRTSLVENIENIKWMENKENILYNIFGYYVQFLPDILEHIEAIKRKVQTDLKELVKLYRWDRVDNYLDVEHAKKFRQKLKKLIRNFDDVLQQPVAVIFNKKAERGEFRAKSAHQQKVSSIDLMLFSDAERSTWYTDWRKKVDSALTYWPLKDIFCFDHQSIALKDGEETQDFIRQALTSQYEHPVRSKEWEELWLSLEKVCRTISECNDLWEIEKKSFGKRRALTDLLKLLENLGLSRHRSMIPEDLLQSNQPSSWFHQPSYSVQHLLAPPSGECTIDGSTTSQFQISLAEKVYSNWKAANRSYYMSMAMVQVLRQICLNFHKDFSLDQVTRAGSFLDHLIIIQQEQRSFNYTFSEDLQCLRKCINSLTNLSINPSIVENGTCSESCVARNQSITFKCMWDQKKLFDNLYSTSHETSLLLKKVVNAHLNTCQGVKDVVDRVTIFLEELIGKIRKSKESLDLYLLGSNRILTTVEASFPPFIVSKQMEQLVRHNFELICELEESANAFSQQAVNKRSVEEHLIKHLIDILNQGKDMMQEFRSVLEPISKAVGVSHNDTSSNSSSELETKFAKSFNETLMLITEVFQNLGSSTNRHTHSEDPLPANIAQWRVLVESYTANLQLGRISKQFCKTAVLAGELIDHTENQSPKQCCPMQTYLKYLHVLMDPILALGDGLLLELLTMHRTVAEMTYKLADVFASLFSKGFGGPTADQTDETGGELSHDGTGMGEGAGINDVSDQIEDEDQLLGSSEKPTEGQDTSNEVPNKKEKGIEMGEDFDADTFSVSEDSGDDDDREDSDSEKLESAMGNTGDDNEVVDEKLWDKGDDENPDTTNEKYESGPSVKDMDSSSRELRAKEDDAAKLAESGELNADESDKDNKNAEDQNDPENEENVDDTKLDKDDAYADPTGIQMDDQSKGPGEDINMEENECSDNLEEPEGTDTMEEMDPDNNNGGNEKENEDDEKTEQLDEDMEKPESGQVDINAETDDPMNDHNEVAEMDLLAPNRNAYEPGVSSFNGSNVPRGNSELQLSAGAPTSQSHDIASKEEQSNSENIQNSLASTMGSSLSSPPDTDVTMPDSIKGGKLNTDEPEARSPKQDSSSAQKPDPNPYRSVGDALEKWKQRVKVSSDLDKHRPEVPDEMEDDNADEYGFIPESEKGTTQALGPATSDQIDRNIKGSDPDHDEGLAEQKDDHHNMNVPDKDAERLRMRSHSALMQSLDEQMKKSGLSDEAPIDEVLDNGGIDGGDDNDLGIMTRDLVSLQKSCMDEGILQLSNLTMNDEIGKAKNLEISGNTEVDATLLWRRYEQITTRLSQDLAEQLRLVMEPTLASKLQGDYKTGKRINMKKVIAYIASSYRKDKIWLRRTRPNKRDYQVIVAVDDSRSMSECHCGDVAIEALVTVCRAMSQLEVGQLAVASFGKKGNIKLLHDFNQHFTGEAGTRMISGLTFKQENTLADDPMVDLLQYLNNMLDDAAANSRLPSGQSPLQQLVLIIGDGRFHEKEILKRGARDLLSKNRMVAYLLLDNPQESIMDYEEVSFQGGFSSRKYLNSFPFPYYIVLKNIEALPRTLADLLRQWFELMQNTID